MNVLIAANDMKVMSPAIHLQNLAFMQDTHLFGSFRTLKAARGMPSQSLVDDPCRLEMGVDQALIRLTPT
jgi:hypothetical protein